MTKREDPAGFTGSEHAQILTRGQDASGVVQRLGELVPTFRADAAHTPTPAPRPL